MILSRTGEVLAGVMLNVTKDDFYYASGLEFLHPLSRLPSQPSTGLAYFPDQPDPEMPPFGRVRGSSAFSKASLDGMILFWGFAALLL